MGLPIIGHSLSLLHAMRANKGEAWFHERIRKYGPISKLSLFGTPTVFLHGQAANIFIYTCDSKTFSNQQPASMRRVCGEKNILELSGKDHKRIRGSLVSFLKPEALKHIRNEDNSALLSDEEIEDNAVIIMIGGYDTSSILLTFLIRLLANEPSIYAAIVQEQEEIAKSKALGELLTWDDLTKMCTWRVAMETLKDNPSWVLFLQGGPQRYRIWRISNTKRVVVWAASMTHMDERIFPNPSKINPTKFEQQAPAPPYCFVAFRGGPRMCPGYEFARIETLAMIHYLVTQVTCKLSCIDDSFCRDPMPAFNWGYQFILNQRNLMV
ncbi:beta-amyrin 28-monooxygenase-like [Camellia sinensis]|uniref:beta-amyrin 28-monooxygenase-like n=1 Tax=Camellia sinensis TaxID=4442 RepID=UPI0010366144|nr:beta-amyrin 28-monooxygenase-like [Camellia sinensis]